MVVEADGSLRSPVAKFLTESETAALKQALDAASGGCAPDRRRSVAHVLSRPLGTLRNDLGRPGGHDDLAFLWVVDFPLFEEAEDGRSRSPITPSPHRCPSMT